MARAILIIAQQGFQPTEYAETRKELEAQGVEVFVGSISKSRAVDTLGNSIVPDHALSDVSADGFDAIAFIGGPGALESLDHQDSYELIQKFNKSQKIVAAICISPVILVRSGIMRNRKMTVHPSGTPLIQNQGAEIIASAVVEDQNIITGRDPAAATEFGIKLAEKLTKNL